MITVNIEKAKGIARDIRRSARAREFTPYDAIIAAQIPGQDAAAAEAARQAIRDKYSVIQSKIDVATTIDEVKAVLP